MTDLLQRIMDGQITEDEAYDILDEMFEKHNSGQLDIQPHEYLGFNNYEWTAFAHGASLQILAQWRQQGWPKSCSRCGTPIDYKQYGWTIKDDQLKGLTCC